MSVDSIGTVRAIFDTSVVVHQRFMTYGLDRIVTAADSLYRALRAGRKVLAFGNGGSASDAEHLVAELVGRFEGDRRALAGIALTADSSVMTALGNDYGYDRVFTRQIEALGQAGDVAFGISTSGRSPNVEAALAAAKSLEMVTIAMTGRDGGKMGANADIHLNVAEASTPRVQEVHRTIMHAMCSLIDRHVRAESGA
jgi:D-sedoheptulose 7-phosphate isomerase